MPAAGVRRGRLHGPGHAAAAGRTARGRQLLGPVLRDRPDPALSRGRRRQRLRRRRRARTVRRCAERVAAGGYDAPQPALVAGVARLHGDLWSGNVLWAPGTGATLIDPAAHGGHAECDLAQLAVFGAPHLDRILAAYDEVSPLADGWRDRVELHQLHILIVHAALFGGTYGRRTVSVAARYA
ncbi:fructosamine kinase family protein [Georgenia sp. SUBG003]|uniref:fructosamine kinase family protein n=1 Tax=Georgenia sp. SUBG003 TaxID=1497974 RepID=UPI003AB17948